MVWISQEIKTIQKMRELAKIHGDIHGFRAFQIANAMGLPNPSINRVLNKLHKDGAVIKKIDPPYYIPLYSLSQEMK